MCSGRVTCGMMVRALRSLVRPMSAIFTPSMLMLPAAASTNLNSARVTELLPAPVRPTIPTWAGHCTALH